MDQDQPRVRVVMLPFFAQGHVKPMLHLAQLLSLATNFHITFVNSDHIHQRLLRFTDMDAFLNTHPNFHFTSIPDGLPLDHPRPGHSGFVDIVISPTARPTTKSKFRQLLIDMAKEEQVTCIITDGIMSFAVDIGEELGIPVIAFRTYSASCTWIYFHLSKLAKEGILPLQAKDMDKPVTCIPGLEGLFRHRDLPGICKHEADHPIFQFFINETSRMARASSLILNTFHELEAPIISMLDSLFTKVYTIGPLHALSKTLVVPSPLAEVSFSSCLWKEDKSCINWLDSQSPRSTIYVSFGSLTMFSQDQVLEFLHGLVNSGQPFLWVMRPDMIDGQNGLGFIPSELEEGIKKRGCIIEWAPQEEVLSHPAILSMFF